MTAVADAIRTKAGSSESLSFPDGFVSAVEGISGEGAVDPVAEKFRLIARNEAQDTDLTWNDIVEWVGSDILDFPIIPIIPSGRKLKSLEVRLDKSINCIISQLNYRMGDSACTLHSTGTAYYYTGYKIGMAYLTWIHDFSTSSKLGPTFNDTVFTHDIEIPEGVTELKATFTSVRKRVDNVDTSITITTPASLQSILGDAALSGSYNIPSNLVMKATTPPSMASSIGLGYNMSYINSITVPKGSLEAYQTATNWSAWADIMVEAEE